MYVLFISGTVVIYSTMKNTSHVSHVSHSSVTNNVFWQVMLYSLGRCKLFGCTCLHAITSNMTVILKSRLSNFVAVVQVHISHICFWITSHQLRPPLWSSGQSSWLQIQRSQVRFPALPDFLRSSGYGTGSTQPCEDNWGATWMEK
jgi:predicted ferric reductase